MDLLKVMGIDDIKFNGNKFIVIFDITPCFTDDYVVKYIDVNMKKSTLPALSKSS